MWRPHRNMCSALECYYLIFQSRAHVPMVLSGYMCMYVSSVVILQHSRWASNAHIRMYMSCTFKQLVWIWHHSPTCRFSPNLQTLMWVRTAFPSIVHAEGRIPRWCNTGSNHGYSMFPVRYKYYFYTYGWREGERERERVTVRITLCRSFDSVYTKLINILFTLYVVLHYMK